MKHLTLLRHADAQPDHTRKNDRGRPLSGAGLKEIDAMHQACALDFKKIDSVVCSNALRARQTLDGMARAMHPHVTPQFDDRLYGASASMLLEIFRRLPTLYQHPVIIAHNPGLQDILSAALSYHTPSCNVGGMHTCTLVTFELDITHWGEAALPALKIVRYATPGA